jgi:hypothetical protein
MKTVDTARLEKILALYEKPYQFLQKVEVDYPAAKGQFLIGTTKYASVPVEHLTAIEAQFCINQLSYVAFAEWICERRFPELQMSFEEYLSYMNEQMLIARTMTQIEFRKKISTSRPINMIGKLKGIRRQGSLWVAVMNYDFEEGKAKGSMTLALET